MSQIVFFGKKWKHKCNFEVAVINYLYLRLLDAFTQSFSSVKKTAASLKIKILNQPTYFPTRCNNIMSYYQLNMQFQAIWPLNTYNESFVWII